MIVAERTKAMRRDAIRAQIRELGKQMSGINPKLSLFKEIEAQIAKLNVELETLRK